MPSRQLGEPRLLFVYHLGEKLLVLRRHREGPVRVAYRNYKGIAEGKDGMRSQLLFAGSFAVVLGVLFYLLELPIVYWWSFPFIVGGGLMMLSSPFLKESEGPLTP